MNDSQVALQENPSRIKQYWERKLLYNAPMIIDLCNQPRRFIFFYYTTYCIAPPLISWLKRCTKYTNNEYYHFSKDAICSLIFNSFGKFIVYSAETAYKYLCPSLVKPYIINPFEWKLYHYRISYLFIGSIGVLTSFIYSYLYFQRSLNDRLKWPYVYDYMMNKDFTKNIRNLLNNCPLNENFHIDLTLKLYPIIKYNYFHRYSSFNNNIEYGLSPSPLPIQSKIYQLKIVQFTAANVAWYSTKWSKVSIQSKYHRIVGVFLCDYNKNEGDIQRNIKKKEIRESIIKIKKSRLNDLNIFNKLDWCKSMCLTLQTHFNGEWVVIIGHRAQYRSFHSVILENIENNNNDNHNHNNMDQQIVQKVPLQINNKTNAEFIHFGMGPKWYNWSVVVAKIE